MNGQHHGYPVKRIVSIIAVALCCACTAPAPPAKLLADGQPSPVKRGGYYRIVSLKPNITEILFALGAGDRVVGVTTWCKYPPEVAKLPKVADYLRPFLERIIAVHPDLIIGSRENSDRRTAESLESLGVPVHHFPFRTIAETAQSVREIAALVGKWGEGEKLAAQIATLSSPDTLKRGGVTAVAVVGYRPLIAVGDGTFLSDIMTAAGFRNIIAGGSLPYPQLSLERLLALDPDVILDMTMGTEVASDFWTHLPQLKAVQNGQVMMLNMDDFHAGPRLPEAVARLRRQSIP